MKAKRGDLKGATEATERALAIMLSLDLAQHPKTQEYARNLASLRPQSGRGGEASRLISHDHFDLTFVIAQIEAEQRAWVAENPENRKFGPPTPFAKNN